jgi:hypothetical protein
MTAPSGGTVARVVMGIVGIGLIVFAVAFAVTADIAEADSAAVVAGLAVIGLALFIAATTGLPTSLEGLGFKVGIPGTRDADNDQAGPKASGAEERRSSGTPANARTPTTVRFYEPRHPQQWIPAPATTEQAFSSICRAAREIADVDVFHGGSLTADALAHARVFILTIGPNGSTGLDLAQVDALKRYVQNGGRLLLLSTHFGDVHHGANLNAISLTYDIEFGHDVLMPEHTTDRVARFDHSDRVNAIDVLPVGTHAGGNSVPPRDREPSRKSLQDAILADVDRVRTLATCSLNVRDDAVSLLWSTEPNTRFDVEYFADGTGRVAGIEESANRTACVMAVSTRAKVIAAGSWRMFSNWFVDSSETSNRALFVNAIRWLAS